MKSDSTQLLPIPDVIDNLKKPELQDIIRQLLTTTSHSKIAVGYFFLSGYNLIKESLHTIQELQLLIGNETTKATRDALSKGYSLKNEILTNINTEIKNHRVSPSAAPSCPWWSRILWTSRGWARRRNWLPSRRWLRGDGRVLAEIEKIKNHEWVKVIEGDRK